MQTISPCSQTGNMLRTSIQAVFCGNSKSADEMIEKVSKLLSTAYKTLTGSTKSKKRAVSKKAPGSSKAKKRAKKSSRNQRRM